MKRRKIDAGNSNWLDDEEDVNPMNYCSNLSDAMLVLAVGIMLALVMAWNVDISSDSPLSPSSNNYVSGAAMDNDVTVLEEEAETSESGTDESDDGTGQFGLSEYGKVYVDRDGNFYVVEDQGTSGQ